MAQEQLLGYDEAGNEIHQIDALNRTNVYAYDGMGRRTSHTMPGTQTEYFGYDVAGNLLFQTNFNGIILTNQYDVMNRLLSRTGPGGYQIGYTYTANGQRATMTDASGTNTYSYDVRDRLQQKIVNFCSALTNSLNYAYDASGNLTNLWSGIAGGVTNVYQYDALNRLTNVQGDGGGIASYGFDGVGNLQSGTFGNGVTNLYQYDKLNRLTNAVWNLGSSARASFYYKLGLTGNRTNLIETVDTTSRTNAWQYDALYRLTNEDIIGTGNVEYGLDAVGNRTNRNSSVTGLADQTPAYNTNDWLTTDAYDSNGNVSALVNAANSASVAKYEYGPFGEVIRATGPMAKLNPFRFSTKYDDDESDFLYYGYRYYNPTHGKWINRDPVGERGGLNIYGSVRNEPVGLIDVLGLCGYSCTLKFRVGWDTTVTAIANEALKAQTDKLKSLITGDCHLCASIDIQYTFDSTQKPIPEGTTEGPNGQSVQAWVIPEDNSLLEKDWRSISGKPGIPILFTTLYIRSKNEGEYVGARAVTTEATGILFNKTYLSAGGILSHELGHYAGIPGHNPDPHNIMNIHAPDDGVAGPDWCSAVNKLLKKQ